MTTKIIQIAASQDALGLPILYALCENGTVWVMGFGKKGEWEQLKI